MKTMQKGFTLIELMIVVAIIAILAAIAIPQYQNYLIRTQVSEGASLADAAKTGVAEYYSNIGVFPPTNVSAGVSPAASIMGTYVSSVGIGTDGATAGARGVITVAFNQAKANSAIKADVLTFSPYTQGGSVAWTCNPTGAAGTRIDPKYLPASCRN